MGCLLRNILLADDVDVLPLVGFDHLFRSHHMRTQQKKREILIVGISR